MGAVGSELTGAALEGFGLVLAAVVFAFAVAFGVGLSRFSDDFDFLTAKRGERFVLGLLGLTPANSFSFAIFLACFGGVPKGCALLLLNLSLGSEAVVVVESSSLLGDCFLRSLLLGLSPSSTVSVKTGSSGSSFSSALSSWSAFSVESFDSFSSLLLLLLDGELGLLGAEAAELLFRFFFLGRWFRLLFARLARGPSPHLLARGCTCEKTATSG